MTTKRTEELEPGDVVQVGMRRRVLVSRTAAGDEWDLVLDPPVIEVPKGVLRRPSGEEWFVGNDKVTEMPPSRMRYADMVVDFNPLTGDLTVTGVVLVTPIEPGKIRLSSKRRQGGTGVVVGGSPK